MWHNKEIRHFIYGCMTIIFLYACFSIRYPTYAMLWVIMEGMGLSWLFYRMTKTRYTNIKELSMYLQAVYQGCNLLDIRDHREGELSVLKSDIYKMTSILKQQSASLKKDTTFLADALSNISHQLKTPLTGMLVMSELLQDEKLPEEKRKAFLIQIQTQLRRIEWLVSTLLKISKIDARAIEFHKARYALKDLLQQAILPISIPIELKEQHVSIQCEDDISVEVDQNWCVEAFVNILKNSMEHTPKHGSIQIHCEDNPLQTIVVIEDNGCGIDAKDLPHVFERFYKGENASSESAGIGLSLSKMILLEQNADIEVESALNQGTRFILHFYK